MKRLLFLIPVAVFVVLAGFFYAGLQGPPPNVLPSPLLGKPAPDFALPPLDAESQGFTPADLGRGKPVIVNFWASWCAPCRIEHPVLEELAAKNGVALYGVNYKDAPEDARGLLKELGNPFGKIDIDRDGRNAIDWGVTGVPETFVIDGKGIIRVHYAGPLTDEVVERLILPALKAN